MQEFDEEVKGRLVTVEDLVEDKGESALQGRTTAERLQKEAKELLAQSVSKLQRLEGGSHDYSTRRATVPQPVSLSEVASPVSSELERSYEANQLLLEAKAAELLELEVQARLALEAFSHKVMLYSTCA